MLEKMDTRINEDEYATYAFEEHIAAIEIEYAEDLLEYLNSNLNDHWAGEIYLNEKYGFVVSYDYITDYDKELSLINNIKCEVKNLIQQFQLTH